MSDDGIVQSAELAHDWNLDTNKRLEELYRLKIEARRNKAADQAFHRPAYQGTVAETKRRNHDTERKG